MAAPKTRRKTRSSAAVVRRQVVEHGHPQAGQRGRDARGHEDPPGRAVPARPPAPEAGRELERAEDAEDGGADDVHDDRHRRSKNRALSAVASPAARSVTRMAPASTGTAVRAISPAGTSHPRERVAVDVDMHRSCRPHRVGHIGARTGRRPGRRSGFRAVLKSAGPAPVSYAQIAISTRFRAPSLAIRLAMWVFTVLSVMYSSAAISLLVRPRATAARTCSSRSVSGSTGCRGGSPGPAAANALEQPGGDARGDERVAVRRGVHGLGEQGRAGVLEQEAAGAGPQRRVDVLVEVERGDDDDRERVGDAGTGQGPGGLDAVEPGMRMSNRHTSGRRRRASSTARRPSAASPTTSMPGWALRIIVSPVRTISWSSAHELTPDRSCRAAAPARGRTAVTVQPRPGFGPGLAGAAEQVGALGHADEPEARRRARTARGLAVVADPQPHRRVVGGDPHLDAGGVPGVPAGVGDRLLGQPVDRACRPTAEGRRASPSISTSTAGPAPERPASRARSAMRGLGRQVRRLGRGAAPAPSSRISASARDASASITRSASVAASGSRRRRRQPGLGADRHRRDVVGDGVVQVAGQPLALEQLDLVELAVPGPGPVAQRRADGGRRRTGRPDRRPGCRRARRRSAATSSRAAPSMIAEPITISRPEPHRNSAYGSSST